MEIADSVVKATEQENVDWQQQHPQIVTTFSNYIWKRCDKLLKYAGVAQVTLVFDGKLRCPLKQDTNDGRNSKELLI